MSPDAKRQIITTLETFLKGATEATPVQQRYEVSAFLMLAQKDFLTDKGWDEIAFYVHLCYVVPPKKNYNLHLN